MCRCSIEHCNFELVPIAFIFNSLRDSNFIPYKAVVHSSNLFYKQSFCPNKPISLLIFFWYHPQSWDQVWLFEKLKRRLEKAALTLLGTYAAVQPQLNTSLFRRSAVRGNPNQTQSHASTANLFWTDLQAPEHRKLLFIWSLVFHQADGRVMYPLHPITTALQAQPYTAIRPRPTKGMFYY